MIEKIRLIFSCFGILGAAKYMFLKSLTFVLKRMFTFTGRNNKKFAKIIRRYANITDEMVRNYIYRKYHYIFNKYTSQEDNGAIPVMKILWTAWLQGEDEQPVTIQKTISSMEKHSKEYKLNVITLSNLSDYLDVDESIMKLYKNQKISAAHFTDYIRVALLKKYGGVWLDASAYMTRKIPSDIWDYDLLLWNKVIDRTGKNQYVAIPFVENFNNGFLVGKSQGLFYQFAEEITEALLFDEILKLDYFANFKAYHVGIQHISALRMEWNQMRVINSDGFLIKQFWNKPINDTIKSYLASGENFFYILPYKWQYVENVNNQKTVEAYLMENY
ncbi:capsular polysaccharide synthesis protein [Lactiplantibacillus argentoratensis]